MRVNYCRFIGVGWQDSVFKKSSPVSTHQDLDTAVRVWQAISVSTEISNITIPKGVLEIYSKNLLITLCASWSTRIY